MKKQVIHLFSILTIASFLFIAFGSDDDNGSSSSSSDTEINAKCTQWDSKNAVEERIESLAFSEKRKKKTETVPIVLPDKE
jgi:hypothetical protein